MIHRKQIIYEDAYFIALNKDAFQLSVPDRFQKDKLNLYDELTTQYEKIYTVHRLDKETSGVIVYAKDAATHKNLSLQFQHRKVDKTYEAIVKHRMFKDEDTISLQIAQKPNGPQMVISTSGKSSTTHYEVIERYRDFTLVKIKIDTGRTHQIRLHMSSIGHPLAVDPIYGGNEELSITEIKRYRFAESRENRQQRPLISRVTLHAKELAIHHPFTSERLTFRAPYPKDFKAAVNQLNKWGK